MKRQKSGLLLLLVIISLLAIGAILFTGIFKNNPKNDTKKDNNAAILGEKTILETTKLPSSTDINQIVADTLQSTKETVSQKTAEVQKTIVTNIEKDITNLTQSQIDTLKLQICRDWGLATVTPTKIP
ncbi:hypothetical protein HZB96_05470 [Candidatus Gottesmanbacteria bacterium]|nr:hypothetical protein [Candidatus Gottesmanbacteria bacterium]